MEIAHPLFLMKLYPKFEISEKTVSKDYSLERPRRTRDITTLTVLYHYLCEAVLMSSFKNNFECEATLMSTKQY